MCAMQVADYDNCRLLLVDKKISTARDIVKLLETAIRGGYALLVMAEEIEQEALATLVVNKLRGNLKVGRDSFSGYVCVPYFLAQDDVLALILYLLWNL